MSKHVEPNKRRGRVVSIGRVLGHDIELRLLPGSDDDKFMQEAIRAGKVTPGKVLPVSLTHEGKIYAEGNGDRWSAESPVTTLEGLEVARYCIRGKFPGATAATFDMPLTLSAEEIESVIRPNGKR